jgi:hypothetical protein
MANVRTGLRVPISYEYDYIVEEAHNYRYRNCCISTVDRVKLLKAHFQYDELEEYIEIIGEEETGVLNTVIFRYIFYSNSALSFLVVVLILLFLCNNKNGYILYKIKLTWYDHQYF